MAGHPNAAPPGDRGNDSPTNDIRALASDLDQPRLGRLNTMSPIIVEGVFGGPDQVYRVVTGEIPPDLKPMLERPFTDGECDHLYHAIDLVGAEHLPPDHAPKALWVFGPPAVGKSTTADEIASTLFGRPGNAVVIDGDEIRAAHSGFQRVAEHGLANHVVHKDAWEIFKKTKYIDNLKREIAKRAIANRQNLKIPEVALNIDRIETMLKDLEAAGYEMHAICLWAPELETQVRGRARSVKAGKVFTSKFYEGASKGALEFGKLWEKRMSEGNGHYKSVSFYDNTVKPSHPIHIAQFEILTAMSPAEALKHSKMCKTMKKAYEKADVAASEARAKGVAPRHVARLWLLQAQTAIKQLDAVLENEPSRSFSAQLEDVGLLQAERMRGRLEGFAAGVVFIVIFMIFYMVYPRLAGSSLRLEI